METIKCNGCGYETQFFYAIDQWVIIDGKNYCLTCQGKFPSKIMSQQQINAWESINRSHIIGWEIHYRVDESNNAAEFDTIVFKMDNKEQIKFKREII